MSKIIQQSKINALASSTPISEKCIKEEKAIMERSPLMNEGPMSNVTTADIVQSSSIDNIVSVKNYTFFDYITQFNFSYPTLNILFIFFMSIGGLWYFNKNLYLCRFLIILLLWHMFWTTVLLQSSYAETVIYFGGSVLEDRGILYNQLIIAGFGVYFLLFWYLEIVLFELPQTENTFFIFILFWALLVAVSNYNLLTLFIIIELITLIIVVAMTLYFISTGAKLLNPVLYFFVLNVMVSTFYTFGSTLHLYNSLPAGSATISYSSFITLWEVWQSTYYNVIALHWYTGLILAFLLIIFFLKLTLAPFSIWIIRIYNELPFILLCLLMTIYKIAFCCLALTLFISVIDLIPPWHVILTNLSLFVIYPSLFIGCFAYRMQSFRVVLALTTVSQFGFIWAGVLMTNSVTVQFSIIYLIMYCIQIFGLLGLVLWLRPSVVIDSVQHLCLVQRVNSTFSWLFFLSFLNLAGIPPLLGFFGKYWLFLHFYNSGFFLLSFCSLLSSFIMSIIYFQLAVKVMTPFQDEKVVRFTNFKNKQTFLQNLRTVANLAYYRLMEKSFIGYGLLSLGGLFWFGWIVIKIETYTTAIIYRITERSYLLLEKPYASLYQPVTEEPSLHALFPTSVTGYPYFDRMACLAWHPEEVWEIINKSPRLQVLLKFELDVLPVVPVHISSRRWLEEFAAHGIDYSSFIMAQTQLDWHKTGGVRLTMADFEPVFNKQRSVRDLVALLEQHAGPHNLRCYKPYEHYRYFVNPMTKEKILELGDACPHRPTLNELLGPEHSVSWDEYLDKLHHIAIDDLHLSFKECEHVERAILQGVGDFDTHLLWYHVDQPVFRYMCQQLVDAKIPYNEFVYFLIKNNIAWDYYGHVFEHLANPFHPTDWIKQVHEAHDDLIFDEIVNHPEMWEGILPPEERLRLLKINMKQFAADSVVEEVTKENVKK